MSVPIPTGLAALIAKARATVEQAEVLKKAEAAAKKAKAGSAEQLTASSEAQRIRNEVDWRPTALVYLIDQWTCGHCGQTSEAPQGMFVFKEHVRLANATALIPVAAGADLPELPRRIKYAPRQVSMCPACCASSGFFSELVEHRVERGRFTIPAQEGAFVREWRARRAPTKDQA